MKNNALQQAIKSNRRNWDERALIHSADENGFYRVQEFRAGHDVLGPIESTEIGDVAGLEVLHLQCHFGLDTLSLARRGARVTGLDFSSNAIAIARQLAEETNLSARFTEGDVHRVRDLVPSTFDLVYATWGVFCWIPDAKLWIRNAASRLKPGGRLYLADDHPAAGMLDETTEGHLAVVRDYTTRGAAEIYESETTYTGVATRLQNTTHHEWRHALEEFVGGVVEAGLQLSFLHEHARLPWQRFACLQKDETGLWSWPGGMPSAPLAFSLMARKP